MNGAERYILITSFGAFILLALIGICLLVKHFREKKEKRKYCDIIIHFDPVLQKKLIEITGKAIEVFKKELHKKLLDEVRRQNEHS